MKPASRTHASALLIWAAQSHHVLCCAASDAGLPPGAALDRRNLKLNPGFGGTPL